MTVAPPAVDLLHSAFFFRTTSTFDHTPRMQLAASCRLERDGEAPVVAYLTHPCIAETMYADAGLIQEPVAQFTAIVIHDQEVAFLRRTVVDAAESRSTMALGTQMPTHSGIPATMLELRVKLAPLGRLAAATLLIPLEVPQYALLTLPGSALVAGLALANDHTMRGLLAFAVVAATGFGAQLELRSSDGHGQATRDLANVISIGIQPNDAILYGPTAADGLIGRDIIARYVPADRRPVDSLVTRAPRTGGQIPAAECAAVSTCLKAAPRCGCRGGRTPLPVRSTASPRRRMAPSEPTTP